MSATIAADQKKTMTFAAYYRPPNRADDVYFTQTKEERENLRKKHKKSIFLIGTANTI